MVWNSARFFFPLILVLICLPTHPILLYPIQIGFAMALICGLSWLKNRSRLLREITTLCLFLIILLTIRDARMQRIQEKDDLKIPDQVYIDLHGTISSQILDRPEGGVLFQLTTTSAEFKKKNHPLRSVLQVHLAGEKPFAGLAKGAKITIAAKVSSLTNRYRFNLPNPIPLALAKGIDGYAFCKSSKLLQINKPASIWWQTWQHWRSYLSRTIDALPFAEEPGSLARPLFKSIFLGAPFRGAPEVQKQFLISGSLHLLAISGTHIALVTTACLLLFAWTPGPLRRFLCGLIILFYLLQAAAPISAQRAAIVAWFWLLAVQRKRTIHMTHILGLAGCFDIFLNPFIVHSPSFLLTYTICFALAYWMDWISGDISSSGKNGSLWSKPRSLFKTQIIAGLTAAPLTLHLFNQTSLAVLPAGMLLIPLFGLLLPLAAFSLFLFMLWPASFSLTGLVLQPVISLLTYLLKLFSHGDFLLFYRHSPSWGLVCGYLGLLLLAGAFFKRRWLCMPAMAGALLILGFWLLPDTPRRPPQTEIIIPDIGQGEMQALVFPSGRSMLIDCGGTPIGDQRFITRQIIAWLLNNRIHPEWIALSHFHADHCGSLPELLTIFKPNQVFISEHPSQNPLYIDARQASPPSTHWTPVQAPFRLEIEGASLSWLYPDQYACEETETHNGHSQVVLLKTGATSMLFCGDIGVEEEETLVEKYGSALKADILKVPHHGSRFSSSLPFIRAVSPRLAIYHCGRRNLYAFPHKTILARYSQLGIQNRCTWQGDLILSGKLPFLFARSADKKGIPGFFTPLP